MSKLNLKTQKLNLKMLKLNGEIEKLMYKWQILLQSGALMIKNIKGQLKFSKIWKYIQK